MKGFAIDGYKQRLRLRELPTPEIGETEVLVAIRAAGVNPLDAKIASGQFKLILPYKMPLVLGHDLAGVVARVGPRVERFKPGDEVFAKAADGRIGAFAEFISLSQDDLALKPKSLSIEEAASLPLVALTAWQVLVERAKVKTGEKVFIQAGSGGLGSVAIQLARHLGASVATTASGANVGWVKELGADVVVDYRKEAFETKLSGYDVVLDTLGGETLKKSVDVLKPGGKLIGVAGPPDHFFAEQQGLSWPLQLVMRLLSFGVRSRAERQGASYRFHFMRASGAQLAEIAELVDAGAIRPVVDRIFPFNETPQALEYVLTGRAKGKVVVSVTAHALEQ